LGAAPKVESVLVSGPAGTPKAGVDYPLHANHSARSIVLQIRGGTRANTKGLILGALDIEAIYFSVAIEIAWK
jgi:hypothetical protein